MNGYVYTSSAFTSPVASVSHTSDGKPFLNIGLNGAYAKPYIHFDDPASARALAAVILAGADDLEMAAARNRAAA